MNDSYVLEDAEPDSESKSGAVWIEPKVEDCPVIPLGFEGGYVHFALPEGELRREPASKIAGMLKTDLFVSLEGRVFLAQWRDNDGKLQRDMAAQWFVDRCRKAGRWDSDRPQRGYGVWSTVDGPVVHAGDAVGRWPFGESDWESVAEALRTGAQARGPLWLLRPPAPRPGKPATIAEGEKLRELMNLWNFAPLDPRDPEGLSEADALFGWQGTALLGAIPPFRPHASVSGGAGAGKTTLSRLLQAAGSANAGDLLDSFSEAGLRNGLSGEARALYLDEAEPSVDGQGPVEKALEVLRRMSTGEGSTRRQGDTGGRTAGQTAVGSAYLASILPVQLGDAMATRVVEVRLRLLGKAKGGADEKLKEAIDWAREISPGLLARAVREAKRYRTDVSLLKAALGESGQTPRAADLVAALAAGRRLLLHDEALTIETAREEVARWSALIRNREETSAAQNPGQACLSRIWAINSGQHAKDRHLTIGEMIQEQLESPGVHEKVLKTFGLKVENGHGNHDRPGPWLVISTNHPALSRALAGTHYANWRGVLEHLADLGEAYAPRPLPTPVRFGMHQSRALAVPLTPWLERPVGLGADPAEVSAFEPPVWDGPGDRASRPASHGESHD
ncbi:hypothetical protein [Brevundimonas naejangsanensis]|uniref:hypothetical protein n=1 Tax=Brevundimonas naejangsanensis TaxID=588932 RepID=UPI0026E944AA|nr:hypothetical protein [Brevundimonas naejangsanensis]